MDAGHTITSNSRGAHPQAVAVSDGTAFASQGPQLQPAHELRYVSAEKSTLRDRKRGVGLEAGVGVEAGEDDVHDEEVEVERREAQQGDEGDAAALPPRRRSACR